MYRNDDVVLVTTTPAMLYSSAQAKSGFLGMSDGGYNSSELIYANNASARLLPSIAAKRASFAFDRFRDSSSSDFR